MKATTILFVLINLVGIAVLVGYFGDTEIKGDPVCFFGGPGLVYYLTDIPEEPGLYAVTVVDSAKKIAVAPVVDKPDTTGFWFSHYYDIRNEKPVVEALQKKYPGWQVKTWADKMWYEWTFVGYLMMLVGFLLFRLDRKIYPDHPTCGLIGTAGSVIGLCGIIPTLISMIKFTFGV